MSFKINIPELLPELLADPIAAFQRIEREIAADAVTDEEVRATKTSRLLNQLIDLSQDIQVGIEREATILGEMPPEIAEVFKAIMKHQKTAYAQIAAEVDRRFPVPQEPTP